MALTLSGTNGIVGAGFTVDNSGVSVTAGVGTFGSLAAPAAGLTGALPAISAASLTQIPAANIVGVCTSGLTKTGGFGKIVQVVSNVYSDRVGFSVASGGIQNLTAFETTITPTSTSNKILILGQLAIGHDGGQFLHVGLRINGSITAGAANGNGVESGSCRIAHIGINPPNSQAAGATPINFLHSPNSTSQQAYTFQLSHTSGSTRNIFINYGGSSSTGAEEGRYISTVTLLEVAA